MNTKFSLPIAAGVLCATSMALADGRQPNVLPTTPSAVRYHLHEDANGPGGERLRDQQISLMATSGGYGAVVSSSGRPDETLSLSLEDGALAADPVPPDDQRSTVEALRFLVSLAHAPGPISPGQTWTGATTVDLPGGDAVRIPLSITANDVQGDDVTLAATGRGAGTVHAKGHSAEAGIDLALRASFHDGHVVSATTLQKVTAHVPFRTIVFTDMWSITP